MGRWVVRAGLPALVAVWCLAALPAAAGNDECFYCGMRRADYGHSWVEIQYRIGPVFGFCSLHCAAIHLALHPEDPPSSILVADYLSHRLIDADRAHWVIGGRKAGVMTARAKWAFAGKADARRFVAGNGGRLATVADALKAATEDMYRDIRDIQKRRKAVRSKTIEQNQQ